MKTTKTLFFLLFTLLSTLTAGAQDITYYDLWLGETQVTSANKDNILSRDTGFVLTA